MPLNQPQDINRILPYDPGQLPTKPSPDAGFTLAVELPGLPPYKDRIQSIRNPAHPRYHSFVALRRAAIIAMNGQAWYRGPVQLDLTIHAPMLEHNRSLNDYLGGVMDTLDGSHGPSFTYLPIVYEDDCQVCSGRNEYIKTDEEKYFLRVVFLPDMQSSS